MWTRQSSFTQKASAGHRGSRATDQPRRSAPPARWFESARRTRLRSESPTGSGAGLSEDDREEIYRGRNSCWSASGDAPWSVAMSVTAGSLAIRRLFWLLDDQDLGGQHQGGDGRRILKR